MESTETDLFKNLGWMVEPGDVENPIPAARITECLSMGCGAGMIEEEMNDKPKPHAGPARRNGISLGMP